MPMRAISTTEFAGVEAATTFGPAPQLQWLKIVDLVVDDAYQRPLDTVTSRASVRAIAGRFDWRYFAPVVVSPIAGGLYAIVDGQHRTTAAALCGIETVPCLVVLADQREQAEAFKTINGQVTKISGTQLFKAQLAAGDVEAAKIKACAERAGVRILFSHQQATKIKPHETYALGVIRQMLKLHGEDVVWRGLRAIRTSAGDVQGCLVAGIIKPVLQCLGENPAWARHPGLDAAMAHLDLRTEHDRARAEALRQRGQTASINLQIRVTEHLEQAFARASKVAA